ncbi:MAG TPA: hypothetical protein VFM05_08705 [Candidatus Saccharimonadales bacterium]|nr:hypothetical protein [Candidatus Saccharimonadales bacterium]
MNKRRLIAVDLDEVLAQHNQALALWHNKEYGTDHTAATYFTDYWSQVWNVSPEEAERRAVAFHASRAHAQLSTVDGAIDVLQKLSESYDFAVVTVRRQSVIEDTRQWIDRYYPGIFTKIHFVHFWDKNDATTKAQLCQKIGASYLIDDSVKHCTQAAEAGINALLFGNYSWNVEERLPGNIKRVAGWRDVQEVLESSL